MTRLWHKYALALFLAAAIPLAIATWQLTQRGTVEVSDSARADLDAAAVGQRRQPVLDRILDQGRQHHRWQPRRQQRPKPAASITSYNAARRSRTSPATTA